MIAAPVVVHVLESSGSPHAAKFVAIIGYVWMGLVFLAFSMFFFLGTIKLFYRFLLSTVPHLPNLQIQGGLTAILVLAITLIAGLYGYREAKNISIVTVPLATHNLSPQINGLRIVQVSDIHLGLMNGKEFLAPLVKQINELKPDLLLATGDVLDAQLNHLNGLSSLWQQITPPLGKFAVLGNHEVYVGLGQSLDFLQKSGFTMLRNSDITIAEGIRLVGVDDDSLLAPTFDEKNILGEKNSQTFTIFLKHRPSVDKESAKRFDLQLSGHTHRGQIFPFNFLTGIKYPMQDGLYTLPSGAWLYTSRGTGTWGPPMRILSPPEITLFTITHSKQ